jgi:hypothetical protein
MAHRRHLDLDSACGRHFKYRDLIECGKTWHAHDLAGQPIDNTPRRPASWTALRHLCRRLLDPLVDEFGPPELTYCFSSVRLSSRIHSNISPSLDQHAAHEVRRTGSYVCERLGAAVDFKIDGRSSTRVATWIVENVPFDRLYYYGPRRPLHVSIGPAHSRAIVVMRPMPSGKRLPQRVRRDAFLARSRPSL